METKIREIFSSIQGEGPLAGYKQLFVRFCGCNLNCKYCDTEFELINSQTYTVDQLLEIVNQNLDCHSVSLTGGEPLLSIDFLKEFAPRCSLPIYLETNGTLYQNLQEIIDNVVYVSADIKLPSCTGLAPKWDEHDRFFKIASAKNLFGKTVFDKTITDEEIQKACQLCKKYDIELILQPKMTGNTLSVSSDFMQKTLDKCLKLHAKTRLIPQIHKFLDVI